MSDDFVYCLFADNEGAIWAGTSGAGVNRFTAKLPPFRTYRHNLSNPQSLARSLVESVMEDSTQILWVGTEGVLNRIVRGRDGRPDQYTFYEASDRSLGIVSTDVTSMAAVGPGTCGSGPSEEASIVSTRRPADSRCIGTTRPIPGSRR